MIAAVAVMARQTVSVYWGLIIVHSVSLIVMFANPVRDFFKNWNLWYMLL